MEGPNLDALLACGEAAHQFDSVLPVHPRPCTLVRCVPAPAEALRLLGQRLAVRLLAQHGRHAIAADAANHRLPCHCGHRASTGCPAYHRDTVSFLLSMYLYSTSIRPILTLTLRLFELDLSVDPQPSDVTQLRRHLRGYYKLPTLMSHAMPSARPSPCNTKHVRDAA